MMKKLVWVVAVFALQFGVGCGSSSSTKDMAMPDMAMAPDLAMPVDMAMPEDMTSAADTSCKALAMCINGCIGGANQMNCTQACTAAASPASQQLYAAILVCGFQHCAPTDDGGTDSDGGMEPCTEDLQHASPACETCINGAINTQHLCNTEVGNCFSN